MYIGDSTSEGMVMPSYLPDPDLRLNAQLARVGATTQYIEISGARSTVETLSGQANAYDVASQLVANGFRGCWMLALGTNDTQYLRWFANRADGPDRAHDVGGRRPAGAVG